MQPGLSQEENARRTVALAIVGNEIVEERFAQEAKFGETGETCANPAMDRGTKMFVLMEEVGEVARAVLEDEPVEDLRKELIQVAAVAAAWAESLTELPDGVE